MAKIWMNEEERQLWQKTYAAAFSGDFMQNFVLFRDFDRAASSTPAEFAATVADLAVVRLKQWRRDESPETGHSIDVPESWEE